MIEYPPDQVKRMARAIWENPGFDGEYSRPEFMRNSCLQRVREVLEDAFDSELFSYVYNLLSDHSSQIQHILEHGALQTD